MNGILLLSKSVVATQEPRQSGLALKSFAALYIAAVLLDVLVSLVFMGSNSDYMSYVFTIAAGAVALALLKWEKIAIVLMAMLGFGYNLYPHLEGVTYVLCYVPIALLVMNRKGGYAFAYFVVLLIGNFAYFPQDTDGDAISYLMVTVFLSVITAVIGVMMRGFNEQIKLKEAEKETAAALVKLEAAEFAKEIAREMHDAVAHSMSSVVLKARAAAVKPDLDAESKKELEDITALATQSLGEMRSLLRLLRGSEDETGRYRNYLAIDPAEESRRIEEFLVDQGYTVRMVIEGDFSGSDPLAVSTFIACIREASANAIRHGSDQHPVMITVNADDEQISLAFINTIDQERHSIFPTSGLGLIGVRERIEAIGGTLASHQAGERWLMNFSVPKHIGETHKGELSHVS